jgi:hypothetical protein
MSELEPIRHEGKGRERFRAVQRQVADLRLHPSCERHRSLEVIGSGTNLPPCSNPITVTPLATVVSGFQRFQSALSLGEVTADCLEIGLSVWTIRQWAYRGKVASAKLGSRLIIPTSDLDRIIAENLRPALEDPQSASALLEEGLADAWR